MGKASRWMMNLLLGKKDEKRKQKKSISFSEKNPTTPSGFIPSSPYRRWSFGKSSSKETAHKFSNSLDSITPLITQHAAAALNWEIQPKNKTKIKTIQQTKTIISLKDAAATRIQAAFRCYLEAFDWNMYETDKRPRKYYSGELAVSERGQQYEFSFSTAHNSPQNRSPISTAIPARASFTYQRPDYMHPVPSPNYMSNTESSRAKVRSQSEPKQRPVSSIRPKRKTASVDGVNAEKHSVSTRTISPVMHEDGDLWFIKLYDATKPNGIDYDAKSTAGSSHSNYSKFLVTYEPHLNLY